MEQMKLCVAFFGSIVPFNADESSTGEIWKSCCSIFITTSFVLTLKKLLASIPTPL
jgi:hypothetical protein